MVLKKVNIISLTNKEVQKNQNVGIKDGKIVVIKNAKNANFSGSKTINLKGKYIMPSLADGHIHFPKEEEEMQRMLEFNLIHGVTKIRSMCGNWGDAIYFNF